MAFHRCPNSWTPRGDLRTVWTMTFLPQHVEDSFLQTKGGSPPALWCHNQSHSSRAEVGQKVERSRLRQLRSGGFTPRRLLFVSTQNSLPVWQREQRRRRLLLLSSSVCVKNPLWLCLFIRYFLSSWNLLSDVSKQLLHTCENLMKVEAVNSLQAYISLTRQIWYSDNETHPRSDPKKHDTHKKS